MQPESRSARLVNFINFHGITRLVVEHAGIEYLPVRALCDFAGLRGETAQRSLEARNHAILYGMTQWVPPQIAGSRPYIGSEGVISP